MSALPPWTTRLLLIGLAAFLIRALFVLQVRDTLRESAEDRYLQGVPHVPHDAQVVAAWNAKRGYALKHGRDMPKYVRYARMVCRGHWLAENANISPLAPLVILPFFLTLAGQSLVGAMLWQAALGAGVVVLLGLVTRRFAGEAGALLAAAGAALYSDLIIYSALPLTETAINASLLLAVLLFLRWRERPNRKRALALGLALGLVIAAKPTFVVLLPLLLLGHALERGWQQTRPLLGQALLALVPALLVIAPFVLRVKCLTGEWRFLRGNTGYMVLMGNHPGADGAFTEVRGAYGQRLQDMTNGANKRAWRRDTASLYLAARFWMDTPGQACHLLARKLWLYLWPGDVPNNVSPRYYRQVSFLGWPPFLTSGWLWPLALLGLVVEWHARRRWSVPLVVVIGYSGLILTTIVLTRLRLPVVLFLFPWAGAGLLWLYQQGQPLSRRRALALGLVLAGVLAFHHQALLRRARPLVQPDGFCQRIVDGRLNGQAFPVRQGRLVRDGPWQAAFPYGRTLTNPAGRIVKDLVVPAGTLRGRVALLCFFGVCGGEGRVEVRINGQSLPSRLPTVPPGPQAWQQRGLLYIAVPTAWIQAGTTNRIELHVKAGTWLRVSLDEAPWYGRSCASAAGEPLQQNRLDAHKGEPTCFTYPVAHLPNGEFQVGLVLPD